MSLDLGALVAHATIETTAFDRGTTRILRVLSTFGTQADKASSGVRVLDDSLLATGETAARASTSLAGTAAATDKVAAAQTRATRTTQAGTAASDKAAAASRTHELAVRRLSTTMGLLSGSTEREQIATLRAMAAQERYDALLASGTATTRQLATAEASLLAATRAVAAAQEAAAAAQSVLNKAQAEGAVGAGRLRGGLSGLGRTAAELGILIGGIELAKKTIEFVGAGKDLTTSLNSVQAAAQATDEEMKAVRAEAVALGKDLTVPRATAVDAADAIDDLVRAGMTLPRAMAAARSALLLASVAQEDTAFSARVLGDALDEFQLPASQAARVASLLGAAATSTAGGLETVFDALKYAGSRARAADIPMSDLLASIVDLSKAGLQGTTIGTGLAMMITRLASKSEPTVKALEDLGIEAWDAQGRFKGLPFVVDAVSKAQQRFGPNSKRFLSDLNSAFGARAANVMAAFAGKGIEGVDRFAARLDSFDLQDAADKMNRGLGAAFGQIHKQLTAVGIDIYEKLEPAAVDAAMWLGTDLPHAIGILAHILGPTVHLVGDGLGGAWTLVAGALQAAEDVLGPVAHFLEEHKALATGVATAVLTMWAAFKMVTIATAALRLIGPMLIGIGVRARSTGLAIKSGFTTGNLAIAGLGIALAATFALWQQHQADVARNRAEIEDFTRAIEADKGALGEHTRALAIDRLTQDDLYKVGLKAGIGQKMLTDAVMGHAGALAEVNRLLDDYKKHGDDPWGYAQLRFRLDAYRSQLKSAIGDEKNKAAADGKSAASVGHLSDETQRNTTMLQYNIDAHGRLVQTEVKSGSQLDNTTAAMQRQTIASGILKNALDYLNGVNESAEQAANQFSIALGGLRNKTAIYKATNGDLVTSLKQSTVAGATNRQMLLGIIDAAKNVAQATADEARQHGATLPQALAKGNASLKQQEAAIRAAAIAAGFDKGLVDQLIGSVGHLAKLHANPKINVDTSQANASLDGIARKISGIVNGYHQVTMTVVEASGIAHGNAGGRASGGGLPEGVSAVGERGPELAIKRGPHVQILSNAASKSFLAATGMRAPGFAAGTGGPITTGTSNGHKVWLYKGLRYASLMAAQNARTRDQETPQEKRQRERDELKGGRGTVSGLRHLGRLLADMTSTRGDFRSVMSGIYSSLRDAGATRSFVHGLKQEDDAILAAVAKRDKAARHLGAANQALHAARQALREDRGRFRGAVIGSFDIAQAGADANGRVTGGGIVAADNQAVTRARAFVAGMKKLIGMKVFPPRYLRSLLGQGPGALAQVQALIGLPHAQLVQLANDNRELSKLGNQLGSLGARRLDQGAVNTAQRRVERWQKVEDRRERHLEKLTHAQTKEIVHALEHLDMVAKLGLTAGQLALLVQTGQSQNAKHTRSTPPRPGGRP